MFEVGLSGQMFDGLTIWDHIEAASRFGYTCVELRSTHVNPGLSDDERKKIFSTIENEGISTSCLSCFVGNYGLLSDEGCKEAFENLKRYVDLACYFGSEMIRIWPAWQESASAPQPVWDKAAKWMKKSAQYAKAYDRKLVIEMHHGTLCDTAPASLRLLEMIGEGNVGVTLDPVNLYQVPADYGEGAIKALNGHLFNVHIKDIVELKTGQYPYSFAYSYYADHIGRFTKGYSASKSSTRTVLLPS